MHLLSPSLTGYDQPPIDYLFPDQAGLTLVLGLMAKDPLSDLDDAFRIIAN